VDRSLIFIRISSSSAETVNDRKISINRQSRYYYHKRIHFVAGTMDTCLAVPAAELEGCTVWLLL